MKPKLRQAAGPVASALAFFVCLAIPGVAEGGDYEILRSMAQKTVKTLTRGIDAYTYYGGQPVYVNPDSGTAGAFRYGEEVFWDLNHPLNNDIFGPAMYFATDPIVSKHYGSSTNQWRMLKARFKAGTKFFDLRGEVPRQDMPTPSGEVYVDGCWTARVSDLFYANQNQACRKVMRRILQDIDVGFFVYAWFGYNFRSCAKVVQHGDSLGYAIVLVRAAAADPAQSKILTPVPPSSPDSASFDRSLTKSLPYYGDALSAANTPYPASLSEIADLSYEQVRAYTQEAFFGCNAAKFAEDRIKLLKRRPPR